MSESEAMKEKIFIILAKKAAICGLSNISLNDIASEAGIKKPSLYNYWQSREALIHEFFLFWADLFTNMSQQKNYILPRKDAMACDAAFILVQYAHRGFSYFSSTPFREVFIVMDTEKYINEDAAYLFTMLHRILYLNMREVLDNLNKLEKMKIHDLDSATSLLLSSFLERIRFISQSKSSRDFSSKDYTDALSLQLIKHFVTLYK